MKSKYFLNIIFILGNIFLFSQLFGCTKTFVYPTEMPEWTRHAEVNDCITYLPKKNEPHDINVELKPDTENVLMSYLENKKLDSPLCWYETPQHSLILRAGYLCGSQKEAEFKKLESGWVLTSFEEFLVFCHEKKQ